jgi:NAD(P)-dependent dehydrogenase (short-subunit alcohol dehydrogenase family)
VRAYAAAGWQVIATIRDSASVDRAAFPAGVAFVPFRLDDLATLSAVGEAVDGALDVYISNAALTGGELGQFGQFDVARFLEACRINAAAPIKLLETLAPALIANRGRALLISSRLGANPFYGYPEYFASKTALNMLVKQVSLALAKEGVTVAACHPGWVETEATSAMGKAPLTPDSAAELLMALVDRLTPGQSGKFFDPDGSELPIVPQQMDVKFYSKPRSATL